jgi:hypothetical protein
MPDASHDLPAAFRGHRDVSWILVPGIARDPFKAPDAFCNSPEDQSAERVLYLYFRDFCASLMPPWVSEGSETEVAWRKLVVAQHHRLPTRLLDWTLNPLVGLFFAVEGDTVRCDASSCKICKGAGVHDSCVYALKGRRGFSLASLARKEENGNPPHYGFNDEVGLLFPPHISPRISAQSSVFTIQKDPAKPISTEVIFVIPHHKRVEILRQLDKIGVNRRILFPDMDGVALSKVDMPFMASCGRHHPQAMNGRKRKPNRSIKATGNISSVLVSLIVLTSYF